MRWLLFILFAGCLNSGLMGDSVVAETLLLEDCVEVEGIYYLAAGMVPVHPALEDAPGVLIYDFSMRCTLDHQEETFSFQVMSANRTDEIRYLLGVETSSERAYRVLSSWNLPVQQRAAVISDEFTQDESGIARADGMRVTWTGDVPFAAGDKFYVYGGSALVLSWTAGYGSEFGAAFDEDSGRSGEGGRYHSFDYHLEFLLFLPIG